ncbi:MAG: SUMF1/EgtB/PvdO family nonheme iron enzyme [Verrucomicrobia bacterium]|jgi:formylglycine-generating enzyme required for sulfatase activity|nr:SUMF1/EgtB/PvdO family nonheme iron enzyme [Verrucomicrobiota bacterium]
MLSEFIHLPNPGETIGSYSLDEVLSVSILGNFYQATHLGRDESCLLHILPEALLKADPRFPKRYRESLEAQKKVENGSLLRVLETTRIDGRLLVEYSAGKYRSVNGLVKDGKSLLPQNEVQRHLREVGEAMGALVRIGQRHCFLSPDFLFLDEEDRMRVAGAGLFEAIQYSAFERYISGVLVPISVKKENRFTAIEILSPEIRNYKAPNNQSDFYCLGMTGYYLLTGRKPERRWELPSKLRPEVGEGWDLFLSKCLEPNPSARFPHFRAFLRDLESLEELKSKPQREGGYLLRTLSNVPVPKALERHIGLRGLFFARLAMLTLAGVLAVATGRLLYDILITDIGDDAPAPSVRLVADSGRADARILISTTNAEVIIGGQGQRRVRVPPGRPLFLELLKGQVPVTVQAPLRKPVRLLLRPQEEMQEINLDLPFAFVPVAIRAIPGTRVYAGSQGAGFYVGEVDEEGRLDLPKRFLRGDYQLRAEREGYLPVTTQLSLEEAAVDWIPRQAPLPATLRVLTVPQGAEVFFRGRNLGETPVRIPRLSPGEELSFTLRKEGFRTEKATFVLEPGETRTWKVPDLTPSRGTLQVELSWSGLPPQNPGELRLEMNGDILAKGRAIGRHIVRAGRHDLVVRHPDYFPAAATVRVRDHEAVSLELDLKPRPVRLVPRFSTDHPVFYRVNGEAAALEEEGFLPLPPGKATEVEVEIRNFLSVKKVFRGRANERIEWKVPLRPLPGPEAGAAWNPPYLPLPMVWIEPGSFRMGSPLEENRRLPNEGSATAVRMDRGFWISRHEVTQEVWRRVMDRNPSQFEGEQHPVDSVNWSEARRFCALLTDREREAQRVPPGYVYRLPTEAEWEFAARGGSGAPFSFGDTATPEDGNFQGRYSPDTIGGLSPDGRYGTLPVGRFSPNAFGLYDVHGNVAEWTLDRYWDRLPGGREIEPLNLSRGRGRAVRGGSWRDSADRVRSAARKGLPSDAERNSLGFRVVLAREIPALFPGEKQNQP